MNPRLVEIVPEHHARGVAWLLLVDGGALFSGSYPTWEAAVADARLCGRWAPVDAKAKPARGEDKRRACR